MRPLGGHFEYFILGEEYQRVSQIRTYVLLSKVDRRNTTERWMVKVNWDVMKNFVYIYEVGTVSFSITRMSGNRGLWLEVWQVTRLKKSTYSRPVPILKCQNYTYTLNRRDSNSKC